MNCTFWLWATASGRGEQCNKKSAITVGQTLAFCEGHAVEPLGNIPPEIQSVLAIRYVA